MRVIEDINDARDDEITGFRFNHRTGQRELVAWVPGGPWVPSKS